MKENLDILDFELTGGDAMVVGRFAGEDGGGTLRGSMERNPPSCGYSIAGSGRDLLADG